ncbi:MAG: NADH/ubiquinone/plastoquinone (complex I), partial [Atribacteria sp.]|nr:NADH/ubiquinone/plastoquinone (complex I) [Candidatus Atribacteria bacterium]
MMAISNIIPLFVAISLLGAFLTSIIGKRLKWLPDLIGSLTTLILLVLSLITVRIVATQGILVYNVGSWKLPIGIVLVLDGLTVFMLVTVNLIAFFISIYSISYMKRFTSKWKFYTLFLLMVAGMNGVVVTGDIFNLFVFLEIAS